MSASRANPPISLLVGACLASGVIADAGALPEPWPAAIVAVESVPAALRDARGSSVLVLDARDRRDYRDGHIPAAISIDWKDYRAGRFREGRLPENLEVLAERLAKIGVHDDHQVLVCGSARRGWGEEGRIAWMLRYLGHGAVAILDGGCSAWRDAGRLFSRAGTEPVPGRFTARPREELRARKAHVVGARSDPMVELLDSRSLEEFNGATLYFETRGGRIPGARHLHFLDLMDDAGRVKRGASLDTTLSAAGILRGKSIIAYCVAGVRSAFAVEVLRAAGFDARNYDGSFWEWSADPALPVK